MATLQKFKFLATQCAVIGSPTRSPTTSPVVHLRRRKTLRMLLGRSGNNSHNSNHHRRFHRLGSQDSSDPDENDDEEEAEEHRRRHQHHRHQISVRHKLKDLFVSSPPPLSGEGKNIDLDDSTPAGGGAVVVSGRIGVSAGGGGGMRPLSATLRQRLLRRAWRPVLVAIPEQSP